MGKYVLKRLGYMLVVMAILSLLMFLVYTMIPYDRAVTEAENFKTSPGAGDGSEHSGSLSGLAGPWEDQWKI